MTRTVSSALIALATIGAVLGLMTAQLLGTAQPAQAVQTVPVIEVADPQPSPGSTADLQIDRVRYLAPGQDLTPAQAQEVLAAADRVCEARAAKVPTYRIVNTVAAEQGLSHGEAQQFVKRASKLC